MVRALVASAQGVPTPVPATTSYVFSMGQPLRWQPYVGGLALFSDRSEGSHAGVVVGVHHPQLNPASGIFGLSAEGYTDLGNGLTGGARLLAVSRMFGLSAGADLRIDREQVDPILSFQTAIRRGGLLGRGTMLRVDWLPTRHELVGLGVQVPLFQRFAGKTRPRRTTVRMVTGGDRFASAPPTVPAARQALDRVADATTRIAAFTSLYTPATERDLLAAPSRDYMGALNDYAVGLTQAFASAMGGDTATGSRVAVAGRAILLDAVILPYDSVFGQAKADDGIATLVARAQTRFAKWLTDSSRIDPANHASLLGVYAGWLRIVQDLRHNLQAQWKDSRFIWLPLQLALTLDQYDDQSEVDALIARAVGRPFTDRNALAYLSSADLPLEIARTIFAARDYHVLWTHDFAGRRPSGAIDNLSYDMVADVYLPALTEAVKRYDTTARMPVYMILQDEYFYEPNDGRLWLTILQDPLNASMKLPGNNAEREAHLRERQAALRAAVAASTRLRGDEIDARRVVKVHVNVTLPSDFSFRSSRIVPGLPFGPDNLMRDHRKIAIYDVNEADPYRGAMILMGVGIGEHYASATWEDRGYRIRGPATLEAREAMRRLLRSQGFTDAQIPTPLRSIASAPAAEKQMNLGDYVGRALQVHNEAGFGAKESSVARAMLYNLATPGSVIIVPDPLWVSETWAGMLAAAAARGSRVFIIAPAKANAPSPQTPLLAMSHEVMLRLVAIQHRLEAQQSPNSGELRVGLYAATAQINDIAGRLREIREGLARAPWIRTVIPFTAATLAVLEKVTTQTPADGQDAGMQAHDEKPREPQLHQKTQLIALPGAISALVQRPGWDAVLAQSMRVQSQQTVKFADQLTWTTPDVDTTAMRSSDALLTSYEQGRPAAERDRVSFYFSVGTQNEDDRGLASDAEATVVVSGFHAAAGLVDLYYVMARSHWVSTEQEIDQYLPPPSGFWRRVGRFIRATL